MAFFEDASKAAQKLTELYHPDKINYLILGDLCPHLHLHLVPKYQGRNRLGKDVSDDAGGSQNFDGGRRSG